LEGTTFVVEHRKFGLGIFAKNLPADEALASEVARRIHAGVKAARPYFDALADSAAKGSALNVNNNSRELLERFRYFADRYEAKRSEAEARKDERVRTEYENGYGISYPAFEILREAQWYAMASIEAFYSLTEHTFILIAILLGKITTGEEVARMASVEWKEKFRIALDITDAETKSFYERLLLLRTQVRNFVAHGAFGKDGQALSFHSAVGAVPLLLPHRKNKDSFRFGNGVDFVAHDAIALIQEFMTHQWAGKSSPAKIYVESGLPLILSNAVDGTYSRAMVSDETMTNYVERLSRMFDDAANMDW